MELNNILENIKKNAEKAIPRNDNDYIKGGLLYCGNCHTPKQCRVTLLGKERTPFCLCKCAEKKMKREEEKRHRAEMEQRILLMRHDAFPESRMSEWNFANDDNANEKISMAMRKYVDRWEDFRREGKGLLLFGTVGTGKTFLASCVANALIDNGISARVTNFARIRNEVQDAFEKQSVYDSLNRYELLVIDDLSAESKTEYMQEIVFNVIDSRYRSGKPLIVTTNLTREELQKPTDMNYRRTFSRLFEMCLPVEVIGKDRRKEKLKADFSELNDLLGL